MKWLGPLAVAVLALLLEGALGRATGAPELALFLGRFHPLVVHLPIGFFLLLALAEGATFVPRLRERVEPALGLLVPLSALAALAAFLMGQLLALEGGFPTAALGWHRRLTLLALLGMCACWALYVRQQRRDGQGRLAYRGALVVALGLLSLGAHFGGTLTRGESYLSKYAPGPLKPLLGAPEVPASRGEGSGVSADKREPLVFEDVVQPILNNYCFECHGTEKQKGKLRVDSLPLLLQGGESGPALVPGDAKKSLLLSRMLLPLSDDDHMPPEGKPGPKPEEMALLQFWIERGASTTLPVRDLLAPVASRSLLERVLGGGAAPLGAVPGSAPSSSAAPAPSAEPPLVTPPGEAPPAAKPPAAAAAPAAASSGPAVLAQYCEKCHGSAKQKGKLRVDSWEALLRGGESGAALVPGKPEQSPLLSRVRLPLESEEHMPPKKEPQPTAAEVASLAAWIRSRAAGSAVVGSAVAGSAGVGSVAAPTEPVAHAEAPPGLPATTSAPADSSGTLQQLFREKCGKCHIRDKPAGGLTVEHHAQLLEGGFSGPGIVPGNPQASLVMQRLLLPLSDDEHMPPEDEPALSAEEIERVGAWIAQGALPSAFTGTAEPAKVSSSAPSSAPEPLAARSGGCAACSVPGAPSSRWGGAQVLSLLGVLAALSGRRRRRRSRG